MKQWHAFMVIVAVLALVFGCGPDKSIKYYNLGLDAVQRDDYGEAVRLWNESLKYRPDDPETRYNLGAALMELKRYQEAEVHLRRAVELNPLDPDTQQLFGRSLQEQQKMSEAKHAYEFALSIKSTHVPSLVALASLLLAENQNKSAEEYAIRAVELDPRNVEANLLLSDAYFRNGDLNAAYGQLLSARRLEPANIEFLTLFGKVTYARKMYADARESLEAARKLGASTDEVYCYLALAHLALGDTPEAEKLFRLAIYKNGENATAWKGLGETYIKVKKWPEATEAIAKALSLDPENPDVLLNDAIATMNSGDPAAAVRKLELLIKRPNAPQVTGYYLGYAYVRIGKRADAKIVLERFAEIWEGNEALAAEARDLAAELAP